MQESSALHDKARVKIFLLGLGLLTGINFPASAAFKAVLQGQSRSNPAWIAGNLKDWREMDDIPCRVYVTGGPANNKAITIKFDHMQAGKPAIENLGGFTPSPNVVITSAPKLSAPAKSRVWSYTFSVKVLDRKPGSINFHARLAAGAHKNVGSSVSLRGSPALGTLQIHKPAARGVSAPDLVLVKTGPSEAMPGDAITYTLSYSNKLSAGEARDVCITDEIPNHVTVIPESIGGGGQIVGNTVRWSIGTMMAGAAGSLSYSARVSANVPCDQLLTNCATILSAGDRKKDDPKGDDDDDGGKGDDDDDEGDGNGDDDDGGGKDDDDDDGGKCPPDANLADNDSRVVTRIICNSAPLARDDFYEMARDTLLSVAAPGVLANDSDPDNQPLSARPVSGPVHGTLTLNSAGSFTYQPSGGFVGTDMFSYVASDGMAESSPATVTIIVRAINRAPVARDDQYQTPQDTTLSIPAPGVLANDTDPDGDSLTAHILAPPTHGALSLGSDGSFTYMPESGFVGVDRFTYAASDGAAQSQPATVTIAVIATNLPPEVSIVAPTNGAIYIAGMDFILSAEASDPDGQVVRVDLLADATVLASIDQPPYAIRLTNVSAGEYVFRAAATDDMGATSISSPVTVTVLEHPPFEAGPFRLNRQTGLFEQIVRVSNPTPEVFDGIRLLIGGVRTGARVWNATGESEGIPYIESLLSVAPGGHVDILVEYYTPDVRIAPEPIYLPQLLFAGDGGE